MEESNQVSQAQELYTKKASAYQRVFIDFLKWGKQLDSFFRKSNYLKPSIRILDAGCGTGIVTKTLHQLAVEKNFEGIQFHGFDLTENMLKIFRQWMEETKAENIEVAQANVLEIKSLPSHWNSYDLIVTSTMLEYLPSERVKDALVNLKTLLKKDGTLLIIITKRNLVTKWFAGRGWKANLYTKTEIQEAVRDAGFKEISFKKFTRTWSSFIIVVEARNKSI